jgi:hypothetical protein
MKKAFTYLMVIGVYLLETTGAAAQYYFYNGKYYGSDWVVETGGSAGLMNSLTDIGGRKGIGKGFIKDLNWKVAKPSVSIYAVAMYKDAFGLRLEGTSGKIGSQDRLLEKSDPNLGERYGRNLSFRSHISDLQLAVEIHPLFFRHYDEDESPFWSPYIVTGIGYYSFNPQAFLHGRWYDLHPLHLEGQGFGEYSTRHSYKLHQFNIPVGAGIKYEAGASLYLRMEIICRILFTDYLDDVSTTYIDPSFFNTHLPPSQAAIARQLYSRMPELQPGYIVKEGMARGDAKDNDSFFSIQLKAGWVIRSKR